MPASELPSAEVLFDILTTPSLPRAGNQAATSMQVGDGGKRRWKHLPPVYMHLPLGYIKEQAPQISITAAWLSNSQLVQIVGALS
jgi:hypothetical protein